MDDRGGGARIASSSGSNAAGSSRRCGRCDASSSGRAKPFVRSHHRLVNVGHEPVHRSCGGSTRASRSGPGRGSRRLPPRPCSRRATPELGLEPGARFAWPHLPLPDGRTLDLSVARAPDPPSWELAYLTALSGGWLAVTDVESRTGFALTFDPAVLPVVWLWGVYGGWRGVYAVALEAWTSYPARLDQAIAAGRHRTLEPGAEFETEVRLIAFTGIGSVGGVDLDGRVLEG